MDITRRSLIEEQLQEKERLRRKYSANGNGFIPRAGYETIFSDLDKSVNILREMLREIIYADQTRQVQEFYVQHKEALQDPAVRESIRQWQKDIMEGREPDMKWKGEKSHD